MENKELGNIMMYNIGVMWIVDNYGFGDLETIGRMALELGHIDFQGTVNYENIWS